MRVVLIVVVYWLTSFVRHRSAPGLTWIKRLLRSMASLVARVTGVGLATNLAAVLPRALVFDLIGLLVINNVVNLAADIGAMGWARY
jgi:hypothetical protein